MMEDRAARTGRVSQRTDGGERVCAGCLQPMPDDVGIFDDADPDLGWHDPDCAQMWAMREGLI